MADLTCTPHSRKYYTMIGSRETPLEILTLMTHIASKLAGVHWTVRSGGANGADQSAEDGCLDKLCGSMEIYLPWEGFNGKSSNNRGYINASRLLTFNEAAARAESLHPNWDACSRGAKTLHTRNVFQILGKDLSTPSKFVLCWAKPTGIGDNVKGGTGTAVKLGIANNVEIINLYHQYNVERMEKFLCTN
ncbi:DprA-like protein [Shewanella sp. phage 1/4]|uniref:DprA-like DNA recombination-mediator protein n=1 Tax=Shewanella phage 1/4 TaxID=1458859 RepID=UPI0004F60A2F|nr:DprA-like DNA recombination-mediator protein [Shewanella sp. phage 1/4]AHK11127.1 DprA-like protein [Shewanella sp. phage 1/4]